MPYENGEWIDPEEYAVRHPEFFEEIEFDNPEIEAKEERLHTAARLMADKLGDEPGG